MPNEEAIQKMSIVDPIQVNVNIPNFEGKPGRDGTDGRDGDDAYRIAVRNGFLGTEKEWLLALKGQDGKSASAPTARQTLLQNNIWCEDDTVDSVFTAIIGNWGKPMPRTEFKPLTLQTSMVVGLKDLTFNGEPHYKLKIDSKEPIEFDSNGVANVTIENTNAGDSFTAYYLGYKNQQISNKLYSYGDLSQTFKLGNLIDTKITDSDTSSYAFGIKVSVYDNNVVVLENSQKGGRATQIDENKLKPIFEWAKSKISSIDTVILDNDLTVASWKIQYLETFEVIAKAIGHGVNIKIDLTGFQYGDTTRGEKMFDSINISDRRGKYYIGKILQVGDSNLMLLKDDMRHVRYNYNTHQLFLSNE